MARNWGERDVGLFPFLARPGFRSIQSLDTQKRKDRGVAQSAWWRGFLVSAQVLDLSTAQLVYSTSFFKSLSTGGNVSKALVSSPLSPHPATTFTHGPTPPPPPPLPQSEVFPRLTLCLRPSCVCFVFVGRFLPVRGIGTATATYSNAVQEVY